MTYLILYDHSICLFRALYKCGNKTINNHDSDNFCKVVNYIRCSYSI